MSHSTQHDKKQEKSCHTAHSTTGSRRRGVTQHTARQEAGEEASALRLGYSCMRLSLGVHPHMHARHAHARMRLSLGVHPNMHSMHSAHPCACTSCTCMHCVHLHACPACALLTRSTRMYCCPPVPSERTRSRRTGAGLQVLRAPAPKALHACLKLARP